MLDFVESSDSKQTINCILPLAYFQGTENCSSDVTPKITLASAHFGQTVRNYNLLNTNAMGLIQMKFWTHMAV